RGVQSEGMLCSEAELGLTERSEGLMTLPSTVTAGTDLHDYLGETDYVLDVSITPNRPDCLSMIGVAREIAAVTGVTLQKRSIQVQGTKEPVHDYISVEIKDAAHCYRYSGRFLKNVRIQDSPFWMAYRLHHAGVRAINSIVDITNYVMLELGHPLHAFDYRQIEGKKIVVRAAEKGEVFTTLDGKSHMLDSESCLICDGHKPVALAGIMGGLNSEVHEDTGSVFLESAYFEPTNIRRTARLLDISTESSRRFERGADPNGTLPALHLAAQLMTQLADAEVIGDFIDVNQRKVEMLQIPFSLKRCNTLLGTQITQDDVGRILPCLEIGCEKKDEDVSLLRIPTFRPDLVREVDIIEEMARLYGYDQIPFAFKTTIDQTQAANERIVFTDHLRHILAGMGLYECLSLSLISREAADLFLPEDGKAIELMNPLSSDWAFFRTSLLISMLNNVAYNRNRQMHNLRFFEVGHAAWYDNKTDHVVEKKQIVGLLSGKKNEAVWYEKSKEIDFFDIKGVVIALINKAGITPYQFVPALENIWDQESAGLMINGKEYLGTFGKISKPVLAKFKIKVDDVYAFALDFDLLFNHRRVEKIFDSIPRFPSVPFDLALLVDANIAVGEIKREISNKGGPYLKEIQLFDFYKGDQIPAGKKSIAFSLTFSSKERTLKESEINTAVSTILDHLKKQFGAELRPR
ncbi:phenylalanine--tRNA ligase subunit beta, partial [candidate division KSB1 bacterium]|nr:phenylalanine--tRNA ligase subunit beta [candidate division KSB1 bacterium]